MTRGEGIAMLALLAATLVAAAAIDRGAPLPAADAAQLVAPPPAPCPTGELVLTGPLEAPVPLPARDEIGLYTDAVLRFPACRPGRLRLAARGGRSGDRGAHMVIAVGDRAVWDGEVRDRRELDLEIPVAGWVTIAFVNDLYRPPLDRNLYLDDVAFLPAPSAP